jgi:hypothetical protein
MSSKLDITSGTSISLISSLQYCLGTLQALWDLHSKQRPGLSQIVGLDIIYNFTQNHSDLLQWLPRQTGAWSKSIIWYKKFSKTLWTKSLVSWLSSRLSFFSGHYPPSIPTLLAQSIWLLERALGSNDWVTWPYPRSRVCMWNTLNQESLSPGLWI